MEYSPLEPSDGGMPVEKQRQIYFLGMGFYSAIFWINVIFYFAYRLSSPHIGAVRILAPVITVVFSIVDTLVLRSVCRKQFPQYPELLETWPISLAKYPIWPYYVFVAMSFVISIYLLSQL
jgi:hypothetical protein